ncbi:riboflavin kinase / FMN adenylyltransferase [Thalassobacillus cyri]|uniref:FAD synthase n=1 Tax=Thalassobacillus cyri TaxID=571932 RepID=A0A1H4ADF4_9BACI|nr:FAD synthetase family protein [Thalassobacillus cyri]SEA34133.1 riboflavin kinase / FMN adenylyltransferase [Thalassobacillus cyri]
MKTIKVDYPIQKRVQQNSEDCVIALGFFDGVHLGHQEIIKTAKQIADRKSLKMAVMTFFPHPSSVIKKGEQINKYLTPLSNKADTFEQLGVDILYVVEFNENVAKIPHDEFVEDYLCGLKCKHAVAGFDYTYGFKGKGDMKQLAIDSKNRFQVTTVAKFARHEQKVSSSLLRSLLSTGRVEHIQDYLGKRYEMTGTMTGKGNQVEFHFDPDYTLPCPGSYEVTISDGFFKTKGICKVSSIQSQGQLSVRLFYDSIIGTYDFIEMQWNNFIADFEMEAFHAQNDYDVGH